MYPEPQLATNKLPMLSKSIPSGPPSWSPASHQLNINSSVHSKVIKANLPTLRAVNTNNIFFRPSCACTSHYMQTVHLVTKFVITKNIRRSPTNIHVIYMIIEVDKTSQICYSLRYNKQVKFIIWKAFSIIRIIIYCSLA